MKVESSNKHHKTWQDLTRPEKTRHDTRLTKFLKLRKVESRDEHRRLRNGVGVVHRDAVLRGEDETSTNNYRVSRTRKYFGRNWVD